MGKRQLLRHLFTEFCCKYKLDSSRITRTLVVKMPLYLELMRFLQFVALSSPPPSQLHLLLSLFASMGETQLRVLTKARKYMIWDNYFNQMQEPGEKVLELNKVKKLQKISRLSSVTMYSNCFTTEYSLSLMSKVRKNLLVNYLAEIATIECRDQLITVFCPSES